METRGSNKRVGLLKKLIVAFVLVGILLPSCLCVALVLKVNLLQGKVEALSEALSVMAREKESAQVQEAEPAAEAAAEGGQEAKLSEQAADSAEGSNYDDGKYEQGGGDENRVTKVYLTFDDGPGPNTQKILDILQEYDVKASFFVIGRKPGEYDELYQRILSDGHTLGMHSFSHKYSEIYASRQAFWQDLDELQNFLYDTTGKWPRFYRFPGGSSNLVSRTDMQSLTRQLTEQDIRYLDWNISSGDASGQKLSAQQIADNVTKNILEYHTAVVLLHDTADKKTTVEALPIILKRLKDMPQVEILPVTEDMQFIHQVEG